MTVSEFIKFLKQQPQDLKVAYALHSEHCLLDIRDIRVGELCKPREDGWVEDKRPEVRNI